MIMFSMRAFLLHIKQKNLEQLLINERIIVLNLWELDLGDRFRKHLKNLNQFRTIKILPGHLRDDFWDT